MTADWTGGFPVNPDDVWDAVWADDLDNGGDPEPFLCATCNNTGWVPHPTLPYTRNVPCPDCNGGAT